MFRAMLRPRTRVEEVRVRRGLTKAELARRAGMPPQTLQNIEDGITKSLSLSARRLLAPVLQVREDQLLLPIGSPIPPLDEDPAQPKDETQTAILFELRRIRTLLERIAAAYPDNDAPPPEPPRDEPD